MSNKDENKSELLDSPHIAGIKMSSSLKERLKRNSRSFLSPISRSAGVQSALITNKTCLSIRKCSSFQNDEPPSVISPLSLEDIKTCHDQDLLQKMHLNLKKQIYHNEEKLKKMELVQHYHLKNKPDELVNLIQKWLTASQESLQKLYEKLPENKGDFQGLLNMLNIDNNIIQYNPDSNTFY